MIVEKLVIVLMCGGLNALGGYHWLWLRRYMLPFILGGETGLLAWQKKKEDWWAALLVLPVIGTFCLGYFSGKNWGRALWLFVQAVVIGLGLTLTGHIFWYYYIPYTIGAGVLGGFYKNWYQPVGDFITGCYLGLIVLFVH